MAAATAAAERATRGWRLKGRRVAAAAAVAVVAAAAAASAAPTTIHPLLVRVQVDAAGLARRLKPETPPTIGYVCGCRNRDVCKHGLGGVSATCVKDQVDTDVQLPQLVVRALTCAYVRAVCAWHGGQTMRGGEND